MDWVPREAELEELLARSPAAPKHGDSIVATTEWSVDAGWPEDDWTHGYRGEDDNAAAYASWVRADGWGVDSGAVACVARQMARWRALHGGARPRDDVAAFMRGRCGVPYVDNVDSSAWEYDAHGFVDFHPEHPVEALIEELHGLPQGVLTGLATARSGQRVIVEVAYVLPKLLVEAPVVDRDAGLVRVRGEMTVSDTWRAAYVTVGPLSSRACHSSTQGGGGAFEFVCEVDRADPSAVIELVFGRPTDGLGDVLGRVWVSPDGSAPMQYSADATVEALRHASGPVSQTVSSIAEAWSPAGRAGSAGPEARLLAHAVDDPTAVRRTALGALLSRSIEASAMPRALVHTLAVHQEHTGLEALAGAWMFPTVRHVLTKTRDSSLSFGADLSGNRHAVGLIGCNHGEARCW